MKKAKTNIYCNGIQYLAGHIYKSDEVAHLDQSDFEDIAEEKSFTDEIQNKVVLNPDTKVTVKTKKVK